MQLVINNGMIPRMSEDTYVLGSCQIGYCSAANILIEQNLEILPGYHRYIVLAVYKTLDPGAKIPLLTNYTLENTRELCLIHEPLNYDDIKRILDAGLLPWRLAAGDRLPRMIGLCSYNPGTKMLQRYKETAPGQFSWVTIGVVTCEPSKEPVLQFFGEEVVIAEKV